MDESQQSEYASLDEFISEGVRTPEDDFVLPSGKKIRLRGLSMVQYRTLERATASLMFGDKKEEADKVEIQLWLKYGLVEPKVVTAQQVEALSELNAKLGGDIVTRIQQLTGLIGNDEHIFIVENVKRSMKNVTSEPETPFVFEAQEKKPGT